MRKDLGAISIRLQLDVCLIDLFAMPMVPHADDHGDGDDGRILRDFQSDEKSLTAWTEDHHYPWHEQDGVWQGDDVPFPSPKMRMGDNHHGVSVYQVSASFLFLAEVRK